ncbi:hypothetical protein HDK64DRAFT_46431 [Phyllosticta capitalensis]
MPFNTESIIALVSLIVTIPPTLLVLYQCVKQRRRTSFGTNHSFTFGKTRRSGPMVPSSIPVSHEGSRRPPWSISPKHINLKAPGATLHDENRYHDYPGNDTSAWTLRSGTSLLFHHEVI